MVRYLYNWDSDNNDNVYRISVRICDKIYLILFVGWWSLWAWYIFSLRMRIRIVTMDRITFSM